MSDCDRVWMRPPDDGEPQQVDATPDVLIPLLVQGWRQVEPPQKEDDDVR